MIVQGKCAAVPAQIKVKLDYGIKSMELQLFPGNEVDEVIATLNEFPNLDILTVHTALDYSSSFIPCVNLDSLEHPVSHMYFNRACHIAQAIATCKGHKVGVILHNDFTEHDFKMHPSTFDDVVAILQNAKTMWPDVYFMIENVTPFDGDFEQLYNGVTPKQLWNVIALFETKGIDLYVCFDLCHNTMTKQAYEKLLAGTSLYSEKDTIEEMFTYRRWFEVLGEKIRNIHISKAIGDGLTQERHGAPLTAVDKAALAELYTISKCYSPNAIWTVEVTDEDYTNPRNQFATYDLCKYSFGGVDEC